jgi:arylsulfatase A-like enzyme
MSDQWRWDTLFAEGHICRTPHLDRLAGQGRVFRYAVTACPLCTPARGALFTGNWPHQICLMENVDPGSYLPQGKLHRGFRTYLERLRDAGYAVSYAGKWHLGHGALHERGIDDVRISDGGLPERGTRQGSAERPALDGPMKEPYYGTWSAGEGQDEQIVNAGIEQIRAHAEAGGPFCAVVSTYGPHFPHNVPREFAELYADLPDSFVPDNFCLPYSERGKPCMQSRPYWPCQHTYDLTPQDWRLTCAHYWGYCTWLDSCFGRLLAEMDRLGLASNTVVAFTADHGEMLGAHGRFDKGPDFYDEVVRIPMIVRDPLHRPPANRGGFVSLRDTFPTLISLAGAGTVLDAGEQARSFWRADSDCAFMTYDAYQGRQFKLRGVRTKRHKYVWSPHDLCELYDLEEDPGERANLFDAPGLAEVRSRLHECLTAWMADEGDYLLHARHLLPPGAYMDGRDVTEQHRHPGW